jgi:uncharacterized membrane protein YhdT
MGRRVYNFLLLSFLLGWFHAGCTAAGAAGLVQLRGHGCWVAIAGLVVVVVVVALILWIVGLILCPMGVEHAAVLSFSYQRDVDHCLEVGELQDASVGSSMLDACHEGVCPS